jgi:hypothetical protein
MYPIVGFAVASRTVRFQNPDGSAPPRYRVGERVPVIFVAARPDRAEIDEGYHIKLEVLFAVLSALPFTLGMLLAAHGRKFETA